MFFKVFPLAGKLSGPRERSGPNNPRRPIVQNLFVGSVVQNLFVGYVVQNLLVGSVVQNLIGSAPFPGATKFSR